MVTFNTSGGTGGSVAHPLISKQAATINVPMEDVKAMSGRMLKFSLMRLPAEYGLIIMNVPDPVNTSVSSVSVRFELGENMDGR